MLESLLSCYCFVFKLPILCAQISTRGVTCTQSKIWLRPLAPAASLDPADGLSQGEAHGPSPRLAVSQPLLSGSFSPLYVGLASAVLLPLGQAPGSP